jgi:hypothetical protein
MKKHEMLLAHLKTFFEVLDHQWGEAVKYQASDTAVERVARNARATAIREIRLDMGKRFGLPT